MLTSEWCRKMERQCVEAGDLKGAKAYAELFALWIKREGASSCVCGKSESGKCVGHCATGEEK